MRNNEERFGAENPDSFPTPAAETETNPTTEGSQQQMFQFVTPTEFVDLPSKGVFYPESHPLHNKDVVEIRHMTAKDEDILTSKSLLKKGVALDRFINNILIDKKVKADNLYVGDKNAIIVAARISGYGREYKTRIQCPICTNPSNYAFDLEESNINFVDPKSSDHKHTEEDKFVIHLPKMDVDVTVRLLTGQDERRLAATTERAKKQNLPESTMTSQFRLFVVAVNGSTDKKHLGSLIDNMPASDSRYLREEYKKLTPNLDLTQDFTCTYCSHEEKMEVPFTADFFWPK